MVGWGLGMWAVGVGWGKGFIAYDRIIISLSIFIFIAYQQQPYSSTTFKYSSH